ncbi:prolyl oligopeptidase family serine peptidase, partial [Candidatus Sumerlaeota bacterium]|nr:prolyl oligopeptidase family serine peptidase [Candidatus Sumerlaeota bacterium]
DPSAAPQVQASYRKDAEQVLTDFAGTSDRQDPVMLKISPIHYVNKGDPPVLTFHGSKDLLVPIEQAKMLHEALKKAGVEEELVVMEGAGHGWGGENLKRSTDLMLKFLDRHLKP